MFKWVRGFTSGVVLSACVFTIGIMGTLIWAMNYLLEKPKKSKKPSYYDYFI